MATTDANQIATVDRALLDVRKMLASGPNGKRLESLLGRYMPVERFCGSVLVLCQQNPDLLDSQKVTRASLLLGVMRIAQWQLSPDPALGQAWLIPRKGVANVQLGWKGCLALAYRHPLMGAVRYGVVGKADRFVWEDGRNWRLEHEPSSEGWPDALNEIYACWAILDLRTGFSIPRVMYLPEILRHKARGQGSQPAWATDPAAMALKTVIADACRRGPFEGEAARPFALDAQAETGKGQPDDGSIDIDYTVTENGNEGGPKSNLDKFKEAHRENAESLETGGDALRHQESESFDLSSPRPRSDDAPEGPDGSDLPGRIPDNQPWLGPLGAQRLRSAAEAVGMNEEQMLAFWGPEPETIPLAQEHDYLRKIQAWKSPESKAKGRRASA